MKRCRFKRISSSYGIIPNGFHLLSKKILLAEMQCHGVTAKGTQCTRAAEPGCPHCKTHRRTETAKASRNAAANARRAEQERLFASAASAPASATAPTAVNAKHLRTLNLDASRHHSPTAVRKAFHKKAIETHPDRPGGNAEEFKKVYAAYNALSKGK